MKKLGLVITKISGVQETLFARNTDGWEANVTDERERLEHLVLPDDNVPPVYLVGFNSEGCYFRIIKIKSSRSKQYISACIFIPSGVKVEESSFRKILDIITDEICRSAAAEGSGQEINANILTPLFDNEYQQEGPAYPDPRSGEMAYRMYGQIHGETTLADLISHLYQAEYSDYASIFFIDKGSGIGIRHESKAADLSAHALSEPIILRKVITSGRTQPTRTLVNGAEFDGHPIFVGGLVDIRFEHNQYATIICKQCRVPDTGTIALQLNWKKKYSSEVIKVVDSTSLPIDGCNISVGGQYLPVYLSEEEARNAEIKVVKKGYLPATERKDLWTFPNVLIVLEKEHCAKEFIIESTTDKDLEGKISFEVDLTENPTKSPIEGYKISKDRGDRIHLVYDKLAILKDLKGIGIAVGAFLLAVIIGAFIGYGISNSSYEKKLNPGIKEQVKEQNAKEDEARKEEVKGPDVISGEQKAEAERIAREQAAVAEALDYLQNHARWTRGESSSKEMLSGLFDAINGYDTDKVKEIAAKVPGYDWAPLISAMEKGVQTAKTRTGRNTYNRNEADTTITIAGYIDYLNTVTLQ